MTSPDIDTMIIYLQSFIDQLEESRMAEMKEGWPTITVTVNAYTPTRMRQIRDVLIDLTPRASVHSAGAAFGADATSDEGRG